MTRDPDLRVPAPRLEPDDTVVDRLAALAATSTPVRRARRSAARAGLASLGAAVVLGAGAVTAGALTGHLDPFAPTPERAPTEPGSPAPSEPAAPSSSPGTVTPRPAAPADASREQRGGPEGAGRSKQAPGQQVRAPGRDGEPGRRRGHGERPGEGDRGPVGPAPHPHEGADAPGNRSSDGRDPGRDPGERAGRGHGIQPDRTSPLERTPAPAARPRDDGRGTGWATTR